jgi:hypothetical protein
MKTSRTYKSLLLGVVILLATASFAANKGGFSISTPVTVAGKHLVAGDYTVTWEGTGPNVEAKILKGKNVVATTPARLIEVKTESQRGVVTKRNPDGSDSLISVQLGGKKPALLTIGETSPSTEASNSVK